MTDQERELRNETLERLAAKAREGDRDALESLVVALRADVYRIALRFRWHPEDAEDATATVLQCGRVRQSGQSSGVSGAAATRIGEG